MSHLKCIYTGRIKAKALFFSFMKEKECRRSKVEDNPQVTVTFVRNNAGVEMQMIGHFKMLFSLLGSPHHSVQVNKQAISCLGSLSIICLRTLPSL